MHFSPGVPLGQERLSTMQAAIKRTGVHLPRGLGDLGYRFQPSTPPSCPDNGDPFALWVCLHRHGSHVRSLLDIVLQFLLLFQGHIRPQVPTCFHEEASSQLDPDQVALLDSISIPIGLLWCETFLPGRLRIECTARSFNLRITCHGRSIRYLRRLVERKWFP